MELKKARRRKTQSNNGARERKSEEEKEKLSGLKAKLGNLKNGGKPKSSSDKVLASTIESAPCGHNTYSATTPP